MAGLDAHARRLPRVSIGLPVYNGMPTIGTAIESLLAQDYGDFELYISDNASTDGTADVCASFARLDARVRVDRLPRNIGATRNFERVMLASRSDYFMWAAHDDVRDPTFVRLAVEALDRTPDAVLAISDVGVIHDAGVGTHMFAADVASDRPRTRLRWILRNGGWAAIYGLLRRRALARTRLLSAMRHPEQMPLSPDYLVVDLSLMGPFARLEGALLTCHGRAPQPVAELARKLDPASAPRPGSVAWWLLHEVWTLGGRYGLDVRSRMSVVLEMAQSLGAPGVLHEVMCSRHETALRAAWLGGRYREAAALLSEKPILQTWRG